MIVVCTVTSIHRGDLQILLCKRRCEEKSFSNCRLGFIQEVRKCFLSGFSVQNRELVSRRISIIHRLMDLLLVMSINRFFIGMFNAFTEKQAES